jgi:hypothetical protein
MNSAKGREVNSLFVKSNKVSQAGFNHLKYPSVEAMQSRSGTMLNSKEISSLFLKASSKSVAELFFTVFFFMSWIIELNVQFTIIKIAINFNNRLSDFKNELPRHRTARYQTGNMYFYSSQAKGK